MLLALDTKLQLPDYYYPLPSTIIPTTPYELIYEKPGVSVPDGPAGPLRASLFARHFVR